MLIFVNVQNVDQLGELISILIRLSFDFFVLQLKFPNISFPLQKLANENTKQKFFGTKYLQQSLTFFLDVQLLLVQFELRLRQPHCPTVNNERRLICIHNELIVVGKKLT